MIQFILISIMIIEPELAEMVLLFTSMSLNLRLIVASFGNPTTSPYFYMDNCLYDNNVFFLLCINIQGPHVYMVNNMNNIPTIPCVKGKEYLYFLLYQSFLLIAYSCFKNNYTSFSDS